MPALPELPTSPGQRSGVPEVYTEHWPETYADRYGDSAPVIYGDAYVDRYGDSAPVIYQDSTPAVYDDTADSAAVFYDVPESDVHEIHDDQLALPAGTAPAAVRADEPPADPPPVATAGPGRLTDTFNALAGSIADTDDAAEAERQRGLRRMKGVALGFLIAATVIFLACRWAQSTGALPPWVGYVGAAAEAGMVGALADWFAVTALFRHPLGIPIPHTAIIRRKKDQLGEGLGTFVRENFLSPAVVETKLRDANITGRVGTWVAERRNADRVAAEASNVLRTGVELLNDSDIEGVIDSVIVRRLAEPLWAPPVGKILGQVLAEDRHEPLIQLLADRAHRWALDSGETIERVVDRDSPSWTPKFVDHLVGDKIHRELIEFTDKVRRNPQHDLRLAITRFLHEFADDLQNDPQMIERVEEIKQRLIARDEVANAARTAWRTLKKMVLEGIDDPSSQLRGHISDAVMRAGAALRDDPLLRSKVDDWIVRGAQHLVAQYGVEITSIITETIQRWDAEDASRRIESHVGRDLQFIRINGTVVGALAGLIIYTVAQIIF